MRWFENYLSDRMQYVVVDSVESSRQSIKCGVPQGSTLGPTLFLVYVNSMSNLKLNGNLRLYADDATIVYYGRTIEQVNESMASDLIILKKWVNSHKLSLNMEKSSYMYIHKNQRERCVNDAFELKRVTDTKFLGLKIDDRLSWKDHVSHVCGKVAGPIGVLRRMYTVPRKYLRSIYFSLIHSHLQYLNLIWSNASNCTLKPLKLLQNKAIKNLYSLDKRYPTADLYNLFRIRSIKSINEYQTSMFINQVLNSKRHSCLKFTYRNDVHDHSTRANAEVNLPQVNSQMGMNSISYRGVHLYNRLPNSIKNFKGHKFKKNINDYIQYYRED